MSKLTPDELVGYLVAPVELSSFLRSVAVIEFARYPDVIFFDSYIDELLSSEMSMLGDVAVEFCFKMEEPALPILKNCLSRGVTELLIGLMLF